MARLFVYKQCVVTYIALLISVMSSNFCTVNGNKKTEKPETSTVTDARKHLCCARHQKVVDVGHGITGEVIKIDIGYCRSFCPRHYVDDRGDASRPAVQKCMPNMYCRPKTARLERVSTIQGVRSIEVVDTCDCSISRPCRRDTYLQALHTATPYQVEIDVGTCVGSCKKYSCRPSRNSTLSVRGPNGDEIHQVIERCACAGSCHRMDLIETVLDFSGVEIRGNMKIADVRPNVRHINVGQCVGSCSANITETCLVRDKKNPAKCLSGLFLTNRSCTPAKFKVYEYRTRRGFRRQIIQITQCSCV